MHTSELSQINKLTEPWLTENDTFQKQLKFAFKYKNCIHEQPLMSGYHSLPRGAVKVQITPHPHVIVRVGGIKALVYRSRTVYPV